MNKTVVLGSRGSDLALKQTEWVIAKLKEVFPEIECKIKIIKTKGDKILDVTLDKIGGKGLFVKEIEHELLQGTIDMAVHSMKDVPVEMPDGLRIAAVSCREDARDVLVSRTGKKIMEMPAGAVVGTSSLRRQVQILQMRPDIHIVPLRGNILTRLNKVKSDFDAIVLAAAGLKRAGLEYQVTEYFESDQFIPAVGQGILGIETRDDDNISQEMLKTVHDDHAFICLQAERAFLARLNGGCHVPIGAYACLEENTLKMHGMLYRDHMVKEYTEGDIDHPEELGIALAEKILAKFNG
ncbi:hydroxymethylbilane synthase [Petroclostridium sp. X23]|uniref:hydroxymethylbilane synthase n=1 Tax=Petroclostridium sp. X23 TaxID=3045146 RepID=UPI0024AD460C|nr:hydroxymethylbilane synthase [Petroclostridium sp. X23]WHH59212.1 hydroxymethylbilane synthase [Petroclostridium sp. X23]